MGAVLLLFARVGNRQRGEQFLRVLVARPLHDVVGVAVLGVIFASNPNSSIFRVVSFAWAGFGATFGPVMLFSLFWKRTTRAGAIAGMIGGGIVFFWKLVLKPLGGLWGIYELLPAFLFSCLLIVVVSLLTPAPQSGNSG